MQAEKHLELLGLKCRDKVTGAEGIVISVSFDLYGCIQATMHTGLKDDGAVKESYWHDVTRLEVVNNVPVMDQPDYAAGYVAEGKKGAAEKPAHG